MKYLKLVCSLTALIMWTAAEEIKAAEVDLQLLAVDALCTRTEVRGIPFLVADLGHVTNQARRVEPGRETIQINLQADVLYLLGMMNWGWDHGLAHWGEHPELNPDKGDRIVIGTRIGVLRIEYADRTGDEIPLEMGATAWWVNQWAWSDSHGVDTPVQEPFASRMDYMQTLRRTLLLREGEPGHGLAVPQARYYLAVQPRRKMIRQIVIEDNLALRGRPIVAGITAAGIVRDPKVAEPELIAAQANEDKPEDLAPAVRCGEKLDWSAGLEALRRILYTHESELPLHVEPYVMRPQLDAARLRFIGPEPWAGMLTNIWNANLEQIAEKFSAETGQFYETGEKTPWYGGYQGIGTWKPLGAYRQSYGRTAEHYVTLALRCLHDDRRATQFIDYVDGWLYFYRPNHDAALGPNNSQLDVARYPQDAPPHWSFVIEDPTIGFDINELPGIEETDGHACVALARWYAWRQMGKPTGTWLRGARAKQYGKSRYDATVDAAEFICWLMDFTGMDVIFNEGENTGWGAGGRLLPPKFSSAADRQTIRQRYANANMYEVYPAATALIALQGSAEIAEAAGDAEYAGKWRRYADRLQAGMLRQLRVGIQPELEWRLSPHSVWPSGQDSLAIAFLAGYFHGLDPASWPAQFEQTTRNTLRRQLKLPSGKAAVLGMGYGQGWLTHASLGLDELDAAGELLVNLARYSWDKNMQYNDALRGTDWRAWEWLVPEGTHLLPDGSWYRIGDLSNGANQGPALHALEATAGVDDARPEELQIMPRVPRPLEGIEVENFRVLVPCEAATTSGALQAARIRYSYRRDGSFRLESNMKLPRVAVRLGPFKDGRVLETRKNRLQLPAGARTGVRVSGNDQGQPAWWLWVRELRNVKTIEL